MRALELAEDADDATLRWRALALVGEREGARGDRDAADGSLAEARGVVRAMADSIDDGLRDRFLAKDDVAALVSDDAPPTIR